MKLAVQNLYFPLPKAYLEFLLSQASYRTAMCITERAVSAGGTRPAPQGGAVRESGRAVMAKGISIKIDEELLRDIHVRAAEKGLSIQQYVTRLIERDLFPDRFPQLTDDQLNQLRSAMELVDQALGDVADILWGSSEQTAGGMTMAP